MTAYAIRGAAIVTAAAEVLHNYAVLVSGSKITAVLPVAELPVELPVHFLPDGYLAPGFIDIHVHGARGKGFDSLDVQDLKSAGAYLLAQGITTAIPTLVSSSTQQIRASLEAISTIQGDPSQPFLPGVHLEGPHFCADQAGAQPLHVLRNPNAVDTALLLEFQEMLSIVTLAPELPGAIELTEVLATAGIVVAAGHSSATEEDLVACQRAGLSHIIHLYSGQSSTHRRGPWRVPGLLEASLASDNLTVEIIADDRHLPASLVRIADRCLRGRLCAVSDGTPGIGLPQNSTYTMGEGEYYVGDGVGMSLDGTSFGGSTTVLSKMLPILNATLQISLPELIAMFTKIPAQAARLTSVGEIAPGFQADFVHLNRNLDVVAVAKQGQWLSS